MPWALSGNCPGDAGAEQPQMPATEPGPGAATGPRCCPGSARGRRWHRAASLPADFHTRAYPWARRRDLCPKRLQDLQLCWLSSPWEGSWRAFSIKSCLACVLAAEWVRFHLKCHLGFKTYPQIQERTRPQNKDKSTSLGVSRGLLGLVIRGAAPSVSS